MKPNPSVTLAEEPQWLHPVQLGTSTLLRLAESPETLEAVAAVLSRLQPDPYVEFMRRYYALGRERFGASWGYADQLTVLHAAARLLRPRRYLEIGVFRGRSLAVVASAAPECELFGFDLWVENYAGLDNVGPELVRRQLERVGHAGPSHLVSGSSHETVPAFFATHAQHDFDLVTVDGDHTEEGARRDLETVLPHVSVGGVLVFDDIRHPKHPWLERVWEEVVGSHPGFMSAKYVEVGHGVALAIRRDPDSEPLPRLRGTADERLKLLAETLEEVRREAEERLEAAKADGALRLQIMERQGDEIGQLQAERNELRPKVEALERHLQQVEQDRATRLEIIERQGDQLGQLQAERNELRPKVEALERHLQQVEQDRATRLEIIERQGDQLGQVQAECNELRPKVAELQRHLQQAEQDRATRLEIIERQGDQLGQVQAECDELRPKVAELQQQLQQAQQDGATRLEIIERQGDQLGPAESERKALRLQMEQLRTHLEHIEAERTLRLEVIERQGRRLGELERSSVEHTARLAELEQEQARELMRLVRQGDRVDEARALARRSFAGALTPRTVKLLRQLLDRMAAELAPTPAGRGAA